MPTNEEIGQAIAVLLEAAVDMGGSIFGVIDRTPSDGGPTLTFHFDIHDAAGCTHADFPPFAGGTLQ